MSCRSRVVVSPLPTDSCLPQELYEYLSSSINAIPDCDACVCFLSQASSPGPEQREGFIWSMISSTGVPLFDLVFYNNEWRRYPTVPIGAEVYFSGDPSLYFDLVTNTGIHGGQWDGWHIQSEDSARFVVAGSFFAASNWNITYFGTGEHTGGSQTITTDAVNTFRPSAPAVTTTLHARDNVGEGNFILWGGTMAGLTTEVLIPPDTGNLTPAPIPIFPSFVAKALVRYIGLQGS